MHLPRSVFSQRQLDLFLWLLTVNGIEDVPSVRSLGGLNAALQHACGIDSLAYKGALGHVYYVNSLSQILAQVRSWAVSYSVISVTNGFCRRWLIHVYDLIYTSTRRTQEGSLWPRHDRASVGCAK